ncbi:MAG: DUF1801 domain-containing protein [Bacteroidia bacterium]|nr:DUF1801 domain-containing protein [Bacteroidia bacterium]
MSAPGYTVVDYIIDQPEPTANVLGFLHDLITSHFNVTTTMKYQIPFYVGNHWICYLNPIKKGGVELAFVRGNELSNSQGILKSKGRKMVRGIEVYNVEDFPTEAIIEVFQEAIILDQNVPYKGPGKSK